MNHRDSSVPAHDEAALNQHLIDKGLTAPRVTPAHIDSVIVSEHYFTAHDGVEGAVAAMSSNSEAQVLVDVDLAPLTMLTFCVLVLRNGFTVTGESACASPENFDAEVGRAIAKRNARDKIWALEGYALRTKLSTTEPN